MSIVEHAAPSSAPSGETQNDRLRVITAGRVGNMETRLGTSGFDIVAIADTEAELISALSADDPDAIVVEADLCESLEHVRELAPDAVVIVVGDHTPAGALGRIERGVSGTVMAGLLHALVADGVGGAVIWGFLPAVRPPRQGSVVDHVGASLLSAKVQAAWTHVADALQEHTGLIAAASTVVVTASASLLLTLGRPPVDGSAEPARVPGAVEVVANDETGATTELGAPAARGSTGEPADPVTPPTADMSVPDEGAEAASPNGSQAVAAIPAPEATPPPGTIPAPEGTPPPATIPTPETTPPIETTPPPATDATVPPGEAKGWDEQRPPKNDDNGNHTGWGNNSVPDDPGAASAGHRPDETPAYGTQEGPSVIATADGAAATADGATATADATTTADATATTAA
jgi:hypothetical protein